MGTESEHEVDDDGRGLDEGGDKQNRPRFVGGVCNEEVEGESVEYFGGPSYCLLNRCEHAQIYILP